MIPTEKAVIAVRVLSAICPNFVCLCFDCIYGCTQGELNTRRGQYKVSVHFAVTYLDCWRTSFCVITIIKIVNNNTNDKQQGRT